MKDYHFQRDDKDFDQTVRLDDINEKVKQLNQADAEDELGDANAFLDAFESEKFDASADPLEEDEISDIRTPEKKSRSLPPDEEAEDWEDEEEWEDDDDDDGFFSLNKRTVTLLAVLGVLACVVGFSLVRCGFHPSKMPVEAAGESVPMLADEVAADEIIVYDIAEEEKRTLRLAEDTKLTDADGREVAYGGIEAGDLFMAKLDKDGETLLSIDFSDTAIAREEAAGLETDTGKRTLSGEEKTYTYSEKAMFRYEGEELDPKDLEPCDVLLLQSYGGTVWSVEVTEYHGYIIVENGKNIKDGTIQLDEEEPIPLDEEMEIPAKAGEHTLTVTGSNIETRKDSIVIEAGGELEYDLSKAQEKMGVIIVNANVSNYKLYINGTAMESPAVVPMGEYDLVILKNGYLEWNQHVTLEQDSVTVHAELQKDIQYGTLTVTADAEGAWVYIDGEEYGVTPMQVNLPYGTYHVTVEKDGYTDFSQTIQIQGSTATLHAAME